MTQEMKPGFPTYKILISAAFEKAGYQEGDPITPELVVEVFRLINQEFNFIPPTDFDNPLDTKSTEE